MKKQDDQSSRNHPQAAKRNHQPQHVQNDAPGYGDKKLEGPNRPAT
ncbi:hypothetical protein [Brevibacillus reuszeri]|nr:hypothetical protein [Brevibacillus reuszeri]MED1858819.1 hypothetical protein [Brevibacillus reuszeri]